MPDIAELQVVIDADVRGFDAGIKHVERETKGLGDSVAKGIGAGIGFGVIEKGLGALTAGFGAAKGAVIDLNSSLEQSKIAFTTMLGSAEAADDFLANLQKFAAETPFEFPDLVTASKRMFAFGFESKQVIPLLTAVGDAVAAVGGGADVIDGVTTALGQMQAKGKVSAEEMNQLAERGIPAWDMLAKKMGKSVAETMDLAAKGQIKAQTMLEAFQEGTAQRFGGMMAKQSKTFAGAMSTITDSLQMAMARGFKPFFDLLSAGAIAIAAVLSGDQFSGWADTVATAMADVISEATVLASWLMDELQPAWQWVISHADTIKTVFTGAAAGIATLLASSAVVPIIAAVGSALLALLSPIALVAAAGAALALAWQNNWFNIRQYVSDAVTWIATVAVPMLSNVLGTAMTYLTTTVVPMLQAAMAVFVGWMTTTLVPTLTTVWDWLQTQVGGALTWLTTTAWPMLQAAAGAVNDWISGTLVPTLQSWYRWLDDKLRPIYEWFIDTGWPALGNAANAVQNWIRDTLVPTLQSWWAWIKNQLQPAYEWFIDTGWPELQKAGSAVWSWLKDTLFPVLSEWWLWFSDKLWKAYSWFIDYGWPELQKAGAAFVSWVTGGGGLNESLSAWWSWIGDKTKVAAEWWIDTGYPGLIKGSKDLNPEVKAGAQFWNDFSAALAKTDAGEHWVNILNNLATIGHYLISKIDLKGWFSGIGDGINDATGMLDYFAEMVAWILKWVDKLTSWAAGKTVPQPDNPPSPPGGGGGGGGGLPSVPAPPALGSFTPGGGGGGGGGNAPAPSPSPSPSPSPTPSPTPPSGTGALFPSGSDAAPWASQIMAASAASGVPPSVIAAIMDIESDGRDWVQSPMNRNSQGVPIGRAQGLMQVMPFHWGVKLLPSGEATDADQAMMRAPSTNVNKGASILASEFARYGTWTEAARHYFGIGTDVGGQTDSGYVGMFLAANKMYGGAGIAKLARGGMISEPILGVGASGQRYMFGEGGPEYIVPAGARGGGFQAVRLDVAVGGHLAEEIYVTGRDLAIRRGRVPSGVR